MAIRTFVGGARRINQIGTLTVGSTTNGHIFNVILAHPSGTATGTVTICSYTAGAAESATTIANALYYLLNTGSTSGSSGTGTGTAAGYKHEFAMSLTFSANVAGVITVTANKAGVPFILTTSGTGTLTYATTTANSGPEDYGCFSNWLEGAVPTAADDVTILGDDGGTANLWYGLAQSSVAIGDLVITANRGRIGWEGAPLECDPDLLRVDTGCQVHLDIGSATISPKFVRTASGTSKTPGSTLVGTGMGSNILYVYDAASVGVSWVGGAASTVGTIESSGDVFVGQDCTLTNMRHLGGHAELYNGALTILESIGGTLIERTTGTIGTLRTAGGEQWLGGSGTVTAATFFGGTQHTEHSRTARTFTNTTVYAAAEFIYDASSAGTITFSNAATYPDGLRSAAMKAGSGNRSGN